MGTAAATSRAICSCVGASLRSSVSSKTRRLVVSASRHASSHASGVGSTACSPSASANRSGSARTRSSARAPGSGSRWNASTTTSRSARETKRCVALVVGVAPICTTTSGRWESAHAVASSNCPAARDRPGRRTLDVGSASIGQPRRSARNAAAPGGVGAPPATTTPRRPEQVERHALDLLCGRRPRGRRRMRGTTECLATRDRLAFRHQRLVERTVHVDRAGYGTLSRPESGEPRASPFLGMLQNGRHRWLEVSARVTAEAAPPDRSSGSRRCHAVAEDGPRSAGAAAPALAMPPRPRGTTRRPRSRCARHRHGRRSALARPIAKNAPTFVEVDVDSDAAWRASARASGVEREPARRRRDGPRRELVDQAAQAHASEIGQAHGSAAARPGHRARATGPDRAPISSPQAAWTRRGAREHGIRSRRGGRAHAPWADRRSQASSPSSAHCGSPALSSHDVHRHAEAIVANAADHASR